MVQQLHKVRGVAWPGSVWGGGRRGRRWCVYVYVRAAQGDKGKGGIFYCLCSLHVLSSWFCGRWFCGRVFF